MNIFEFFFKNYCYLILKVFNFSSLIHIENYFLNKSQILFY